jgi:hypothetical protein
MGFGQSEENNVTDPSAAAGERSARRHRLGWLAGLCRMLVLLSAFQAIEGRIAIFEAASALPGAHIGSARPRPRQ